MDIILQNVIATLQKVEVHGRDNMYKMLCCIDSLQNLLQQPEQPETDEPAD